MPGVRIEDIEQRLADLHRSYYGHGPASVSVFHAGDVVVVLFEESFTRAETTLIEAGNAEEVQTVRRRFQHTMRDSFVTIVEEATGRIVRAFISDSDLAEHLSVEVFVLADEREDMRSFEGAETFRETDAERDRRES